MYSLNDISTIKVLVYKALGMSDKFIISELEKDRELYRMILKVLLS